MAVFEDEYFASAEPKDLGGRLVERLQAVATSSWNNRELCRYARDAFYGYENGDGVTFDVERGGDEGELALTRVNQSRSFVEAFAAISTAQKSNWRPIASNDAADAASAVRVTKLVLDDYWRTKKLNKLSVRGAKTAMVCSESAVAVEWNPFKGRVHAAAGGNASFEGDVVLHSLLPDDYWRDNAAKTPEGSQWCFYRIKKNKYEIAKRAALEGMPDGKTGKEAYQAALAACGGPDSLIPNDYDEGDYLEGETDLVYEYHFVHEPGILFPFGRHVVFLNGETVLRIETLGKYGKSPLCILSAGEMFGTPHSWSNYFDILGAQRITDSVHTSVASILTNLSNVIISIVRGDDVEPEQITKAFGIHQRNVGNPEPKAIQMANLPPEALDYIDRMYGYMKQGLGLNDVAMGDPGTADMNKGAFVLLASMAVQQAAPFRAEWIDWVSDIGTCIIHQYADHAQLDRVVREVSESNVHSALHTFSGQTVSPIEFVRLEPGNPMESTGFGRTALAQMWIQMGLAKTPEQIQQVMDTGRLKPMLRAPESELQLVAEEFEMLQRGQRPIVMSTQNHKMHYREHAAVLNNQEVMRNPQVVNEVLEHMAEHYRLEYGLPDGVPPQQDPMFYIRDKLMLGQQPDPTMGPPPPPPGQPPPPNGGGAPEQPIPPAEQPPPMSNLEAPSGGLENPMTGDAFNMVDGGGVVAG